MSADHEFQLIGSLSDIRSVEGEFGQLIRDIHYRIDGEKLFVRHEFDPRMIVVRVIVVPRSQEEAFWNSEKGRKCMTREERTKRGHLFDEEI